MLGGRDLQAGGTWLAIARNGRFAAVTNFRDATRPSGKLASRGLLIVDFLLSNAAPIEFAAAVDGERYGGFNLLVGDATQLAYRSNRGGGCRELAPGVYGLANATLDTPWPKLVRSRAAVEAVVARGDVSETSLFRILSDKTRVPVRDIETDGLPFETAHALSAPFVLLPDYGTRSSTVVISDSSHSVRLTERCFTADGRTTGSVDVSFRATD